MIFASNLFLFYFLPFFMALYLLTPLKWRNWTALGGSIAFYAWGAPVFIFVLLGAALVDFFLARKIYKSDRKTGGWLLAIGVFLNLGLLLYFKYANFFIENTNALLDSIGYVGVEWTKVALPLGISFFTFQKLSYLIDVRRDAKPPLQSLQDYLLYVLLFPQLVAGPIVRFRQIADQIRDRKHQENIDFRLSGLFRFAIGLGRKVLIANPLATEVNKIFALPEDQLTTFLAWLGPVAFVLVIYHDFAGYSDMALGLGRMMGFHLPENFNNPYIAGSVTQFWRRWHLTLTDWFRSYVFLPLRHWARHSWMLYLNLWIVFLLAGLWHGAAWTFVLFGIWHGTWLTLERLFLLKILKRLPQFLQIAWTFTLTVLGIVLFRSPNMEIAGQFFHKMFVPDLSMPAMYYEDLGLVLGPKFVFLMVIATFFSFWAILPGVEKWQQKVLEMQHNNWQTLVWAGLAAALILLCASEMATMGFQPFIYYMF
ncbi:MAG TPA: MBOAT family protein [Bacteroidetes bacterium]|nr:MBOAT family protein [Bacteroidota bacterium]